MTRIWDESFEGASPSGTALSTGNTSYDAFVGTGTGTKVSDAAIHGTGLSAKFTSHTGAGNTAAGTQIFTDTNTHHYRSYIKWDATPAAIVLAILFKSNDNTVTVAQIVIDTAGSLRLRNDAAGTLSTSPVITPGTVVEIEVDLYDVAGVEHVDARAQWGANLDTATYDWQTVNEVTNTATIGRVIEGSSSVQEISIWVDDSAGDDTSQPGPLVSGPAGSTMVWTKAVNVG